MQSNQKLINSDKKPIELFQEWFEEAKKSEINDPNAMNLATISSDGKPSSRIVLLKSYDDKGFVFYTNSNSKKGRAIKNNDSVALNFHWKTLQRQIRIEGNVSQISNIPCSLLSGETFTIITFEQEFLILVNKVFNPSVSSLKHFPSSVLGQLIFNS